MRAIEILMEEHRVIERVMSALETAANRLAQGEPEPPLFFVKAAEFVKGFADGCHHRKEEGILFPAMQAAGVPREGGPVGIMVAEHEEGRRLTRAMQAAAEKLEAGDIASRGEVVQYARAYVTLLRQHIAKEDKVLFPMAEKVIPGGKKPELAEAFDRVEHEEIGAEVYRRYYAMADRLEKEAGN